MATSAQQSFLVIVIVRPMAVMKWITFYNKLFSLVQRIHKHSVLVIGGDMNA